MKQSATLVEGRLTSLRREKCLSQEDLAAKAGVSDRTISKVENGGSASLETLNLIAAALELTPEQLLRGPSQSTEGVWLVPPPCRRQVFGRDESLANVKSMLLRETQATNVGHQVIITSVRGWPGVGKTTLASMIAHDSEVRSHFRDGILWTSLGSEPNFIARLREWGNALNQTSSLLIRDAAELTRVLSSTLRDKRMLLIIDDVWDVAHATPFCLGGVECATLLTTRITDVAEEFSPSSANNYRLEGLSVEDSLELLRHLSGDVVDSHPEACRELAERLEGLPLALQVAGRLLREERTRGTDLSVDRLLSDMRSDTSVLLSESAPAEMSDLLSQTTPSIAALLKKSIDVLDPVLRERFAYLSGLPAKPAIIDLDILCGMWLVDEQEALETAKQLIGRGLLERTEEGHYQIHALLIALGETLMED